MSSWSGFGSACADPVAEAGPARGQSPVGNVGGAGSREPLQGLDGVCRRVSRGSARSLAQGAVCVPQTGRGDVGDGAICSVVVHRWFLTGRRYENYESVLVRFVSWACSLLHFLMKLYVLLPRAFRSPRFWFLKIRPLVS